MSSLHFANSYRTILTVGRNSGLPLPWFRNVSSSTNTLHIFYEIIVAVFIVYKILCAIYAVSHNQRMDEKIYGFAVLIFLTSGGLLTLFYTVRGAGFEALILKLDQLTQRLQACGLGEQEFFSRLHREDSLHLTYFVKMMAASSLICPFFFCLSVPVFGLIEGNYREKVAVPTQCPFEKNLPGVYELLIFQQFLGLSVPGVQKLGHECIMIALFKIHGSYFKYLSATLRGLSNEISTNGSFSYEKFYTWMKLHQDIVRSSLNLVEFYSPIILMYYLSIIGIVAGAVFYQLHAQDANVLQSGFLGAYMGITMFRLYLQCHMADDLTTEANNIAFQVYSIPWYEFDYRTKHLARFVINMSNRPLHVEAFKAPGFRFNKESYQGFFMSTVSSYLAFSKMMEISG